MRGVIFSVFVVCMIHSACSRSTASSLRNALGGSPVFSHAREGQIPQNVNIIDQVADTPITSQGAASGQFTAPNQRNTNSRPLTQPSRQSPRQNMQRIQTVPTQTAVQQPVRVAPAQPAINDRMADQVQTKPARSPAVPRRRKTDRCPFNITSFHLADLNMTQREFEQQYLIPALRAHVQGGNCNSRAMTIYLDWLLHLRERLFNV